MSRVKSTNEIASSQLGQDSKWFHMANTDTGTHTIAARDAGCVVNLIKVIINTAGTTSPFVITEVGVGVIASLAAAATAGQYPYNLPTKTGGTMTFQNNGGADVTVVYKNT